MIKNVLVRNVGKCLLLFFVAVMVGAFSFVLTPSHAEAANTSIYRFYNLNTGTHFYTASTEERDNINARWGYMYRYEGVAWNRSFTPVTIFRFYNVNTGVHFYTASVAERDNVNARWGYMYRYEGVAWGGETTPVTTISTPSGSSSYAKGASVTVKWTTNIAISDGEFGVWARSGSQNWYDYKPVTPNGSNSYILGLTLDTAVAGSGYNAIVAWRPIAGSGTWGSWGTSPGTFTVTP